VSSYAAVPVAYQSCRTCREPGTAHPPADCPMCAGSGFAPIRWAVQLLPDGTQVTGSGTRSRAMAEAAARQLNRQL
jgi:DnaJ-class molecular chaperone